MIAVKSGEASDIDVKKNLVKVSTLSFFIVYLYSQKTDQELIGQNKKVSTTVAPIPIVHPISDTLLARRGFIHLISSFRQRLLYRKSLFYPALVSEFIQTTVRSSFDNLEDFHGAFVGISSDRLSFLTTRRSCKDICLGCWMERH